jgi:uncharacterized membrane protein
MRRLIELILGLPRDVLSQQGEYSLVFNPPWPLQQYVPAAAWNVLLLLLIVAWVWYVYRREATSPRFRLITGAIRLAVMLLVLALLNRPMFSLTQTRTEPSVLAVLVDDSLSMQVQDAPGEQSGKNASRLAAVQRLLGADQARVLADMAANHELHLYRFDSTASAIATVPRPEDAQSAAGQVEAIKPTGQSTHVARAVEQVVQQLQGQRLAGVVLLTDGREMPSVGSEAAALRNLGTRVYAVPVGSESRIRNVAIQSVSAQDVAFKGDMVAVHVKVAVTGADKDEPVVLQLKRSDGSAVPGIEGGNATARIRAEADGTYDADLVFGAQQPGTLDLVVEAQPMSGEITADDNSRALQMAVLDAKVNILYVEGYPRWEYRYVKTQTIRDRSIQVSTLLTSAEPGVVQEGNIPIRYFPQTADQLMQYDVILLGDVDPRQFTDAQLQLVRDFVMKKGGGLGMIAGPRYSPNAWRGTPIEALLPVDLSASRQEEQPTDPFRPVLTADGQASPIFRFFADRAVNERYVREQLQPLYWFARGITARPAISEVLAEHPTISGPDGRRAPLLVVGRAGAGRSLFSAYDDSWRWRYYTGESIFDTYWVQQIRYLARGRKVGQRRLAFTSIQSVYEVNEQVQLELRVIDDALLTQLPDVLGVEVNDSEGRLIAKENLQRQPSRRDVYRALVPANEVGRFTAKLPSVAAGVEPMQATFDVVVPRLELSDPRPARSALSQYAAETDGAVFDLDRAATLLRAIPSAARIVPVASTWPLWSSGFLLGLLVFLLTVEWITRKLAGLV